MLSIKLFINVAEIDSNAVRTYVKNWVCSYHYGKVKHHICHGLSLLEMHAGGNVRRPRCRPTKPGVLGAR